MPLIKDGQIIDDPWQVVADGEVVPMTGPIVVSLARWQAEREQLLLRNTPLGVRLESKQRAEDISIDLERLALVAIEFPTFRDGRAYSTARLLRERHGFKGEMRAVGNVLRDQLLFMHRCGFDAFEVQGECAAEDWRQALAEFSVFYQPTGDGRPTVFVGRLLREGGRMSGASGAQAIAFEQGGEGAVERATALARILATRYSGADAKTLLSAMIGEEFPGRIALVSSFGAEAAILLHMVGDIDPATPVIFLDTEKLFGETLRYRNQLVGLLGLTDVRSIKPNTKQVEAVDPDGILWYANPDMCCYVRKVEPMRRAMVGFDAQITGRKRYHGGQRSELPLVECDDDGRIKINPLAGWDRAMIEAYFARHDLPRHPLEADGFLSIGCMPCTDRVKPGESPRAGRWRDSEKTECGIHLARAHWRMDGID